MNNEELDRIEKAIYSVVVAMTELNYVDAADDAWSMLYDVHTMLLALREELKIQ